MTTSITNKKPLTDLRILVIEDDTFIGKVYIKWLTAAGAQVSLANNGAAGLIYLETETPNIVLLDLGMPGLNGHDTLLRMRAQERLRDVPVIILTNTTVTDASHLFDDIENANIAAIMQKYSVSLTQLIECIVEALTTGEGNNENAL